MKAKGLAKYIKFTAPALAVLLLGSRLVSRNFEASLFRRWTCWKKIAEASPVRAVRLIKINGAR
jgi:hypothetical protein